MMRPITRLRASSLPAKSKCGLWESKPIDTELTKMGTLRHSALEYAIKHGDRTKLEALPAVERENVEWAEDYVRTHTSDTYPMIWEEGGQLDFDGVKLSGRWDLLNGDNAFDLKNRPPSEGRSFDHQIALYAIMMMSHLGTDRISFHVMYAATQTAKVVEFTIESAEKIVREAIDNAKKGEATPCAYCAWCNLAATCPALNDTALKVGQEYSNELAAYDPKDLTNPTNLSRALMFSRALKNWQDQVEALAKEAALNGVVLDGFKLTERMLPARVENLNVAFNVIGLPAENFMSACSLSIPKLCDAFASANGVKKAEAKTEVMALLADVLKPRTKTKCLTKTKHGV